jgi:nicotinamidase-related amidase
MKALLIIDPQFDFCSPAGSLFVPGASEDMQRLADFIRTEPLDEIYVSLDSHNVMDISHVHWWKREDGNPVKPFTALTIFRGDIADGDGNVYSTKDPNRYDWSYGYLEILKKHGGTHTLWPDHCIMGTEGHTIHSHVSNALYNWTCRTGKNPQYILKGMNPNTEMFSIIKAEVPDYSDPGTLSNVKLLDNLKKADTLYVAGEALSHCVNRSVRDIVDVLKDDNSQRKIVLLTDMMSNVPGFENYGDWFLKDMAIMGVSMMKGGSISCG